MRETTTAQLIAWSRTLPAVPQQAREARRFLAEILDDRPADDAILCLSELVANACLHSASAQRGGRLAVRVQLHGAHLRVEVRDEGGPWAESQREDAQGGRGLLIVDRLASTWGRSGNVETGWITWFEMDPCSWPQANRPAGDRATQAAFRHPGPGRPPSMAHGCAKPVASMPCRGQHWPERPGSA